MRSVVLVSTVSLTEAEVARLSKALRLRYIVNPCSMGSQPSTQFHDDTLFVCNEEPKWAKRNSMRVLSFDEALKEVGGVFS